jgi:hypothetical protein
MFAVGKERNLDSINERLCLESAAGNVFWGKINHSPSVKKIHAKLVPKEFMLLICVRGSTVQKDENIKMLHLEPIIYYLKWERNNDFEIVKIQFEIVKIKLIL